MASEQRAALGPLASGAFHGNPYPMWIVDRRTLMVLDVNVAAERTYGYTAQEFRTRRATEICQSLAHRAMDPERLALFEHSVPNDPCMHVTSDGTVMFMQRALLPIVYEGREANLVTLFDVSDKHAAFEALTRSEGAYRELFERLPHPMWIYDPRTLAFLAVNDAAIAHYGYTRAEFLAMTLSDIRPQEDVTRFLAVQAARGRAEPRFTFAGSWRHRKRDGTLIDVEITANSVTWDGKHARVAMIDDVTERLQALRRLEESERFLAMAQQVAGVGSWRWDVRTGHSERSDQLYRLLDAERPAAEPSHGMSLTCTHPDDLPALLAANERIMRDGVPYAIDHRVVLPDGSVRWIQRRVEAMLDGDGKPVELIGTSLDITERKESERAMEETQARLRLIYEQLPAVVWGTDRQLRVNFFAGKALAELGFTEEMVVGMSVAELVRELDSSGSMAAAHQRALAGERESFEISYKDARFEAHVEPLYDGPDNIVGIIGVALDVSKEAAAQRRLEHFAYHDALTGLPNRLQLERELQSRLADLDSSDDELAVVFIDLDGFAYLNDTFGHASGDELLVAIAERLRTRVAPGDFLCRWGGDEFVVLHRTREGRPETCKRVEYILESLGQDFRIGERTYNIDGSAGVSVAPVDGMTQDSLLRAADAAMYHAKERARGGIVFYDERLHVEAMRRVSIERHLRSGLARNELSVVYQPILDARSFSIAGVEVLVRWDSAALGVVPPAEFIPVAEEVGLIRPIGSWVLREAARQARQWQDAGLPPLRLCVNVSPHQLRFRNFAHRVCTILEETGFDPRLLELELTERVMLDSEPGTAATLNALRLLGVRLAIDDFGTGYSSLRYLETMRVDSLKIDRLFVEGMPEDAFGIAIARTIVSLAHSLGLSVVAEGVETEAQRDLLRSMGCDELQGFLLGTPLSARECTELLTRSAARGLQAIG